MARVLRILAAALVTIVAAAGPAVPAGAAEPSFQVSLSATENLVDGQRVALTISGTTDQPLSYDARICRGGITYDVATFPKIEGQDRNCPPFLQGPSPTWVNVIGSIPAAEMGTERPFSVSRGLLIASGSTAWPVTIPNSQGATENVSYTCDWSTPCSLVVQVKRAGTLVGVGVVPLSFANEAAATGCPQKAAGILDTVSAHRHRSLIGAWTRAGCLLPGSPGQAADSVAGDEIVGLDAFAQGETDVAYTGLGYQATASPRRDATAVPVGLNATVLALGGAYRREGRVRPFQDVTVTLDELNLLMNSTQSLLLGQQVPDERPERQRLVRGIIERNAPQFGPLPEGDLSVDTGGQAIFDSVGATGLLAPSEADTTAWMMTRYLAAHLGSTWRVRETISGAPPGTPRGVAAALGRADPPFGNLSLHTGPVAASAAKLLATHQARVLNPDYDGLGPGNLDVTAPTWVVTDLSTARRMGLSVVKLKRDENAPAVEPTPATMAAAVATMTPDADGIRVPAADADEAYPLTFVDYALAPRQALHEIVDGVCTQRPDSQKLLHDWLVMVTRDGQSPDVLASTGEEPLTPQLVSEAEAAIAQLGTVPAPADCKMPAGSGGPGGVGEGVPSGFAGEGGGFGGSNGSTGSFGTGSFTGTEATATGADGSANTATAAGAPNSGAPPGKAGEDPKGIPAFAGMRGLNAWVTAVALVLLVLLLVAASLISAGRRRTGDEADGSLEPQAIDPADDPEPLVLDQL